MKNFKFHLLAVLLLYFFSFATPVQSQTDSVSYNREFGFGTNIVLNNIFNSSGAPFDFMYRWKSGNGFLRLGAHISYSSDQDHFNNLESERKYLFVNPVINFGKEWRAEITDRWLLNYGADLNFSYSSRLEKFENKYMQDEVSFRRTNEHRFGPGIKPFVGIMFKINQRLMLGTEASFLARVQRYLEESEGYTTINGVKSNDSQNYNNEAAGWNFQIFTQPASNIFVYYRF